MPLWVISTLLSEIAVLLLIVYYFYKNVQASLFEYMLILIIASVPIGLFTQLAREMAGGDWYTRPDPYALVFTLVVGLPFSYCVLYGASKGLNWAGRQKATTFGARIRLIVLGAMLIPAILWQFVYALLVLMVNTSGIFRLQNIPLWAYLLEVVSWVVLYQCFRNEWSKARQGVGAVEK